ncbi:hypothetical protein [Paenibacillus donghaensis]|uniref:Uncharacterized protein n=1 Tax=Paenibacillus donghaensis TaxID=414771 RepID=A0A2Z2KLN4_9BACL|nr:hypothetical protein [Paenibacillus donghaensis]ASA23399.1 hypothetical protein B9T62_22875 [Paenibacillus donghaensis]
MEINNRMKEVLEAELSRLGLNIQRESSSVLSVLQKNDPIAFIHDNGEIHYPANAEAALAHQIPIIVGKIWEIESTYRNAAQLGISSLNSYRSMLEYNHHVLAGRYDGDGEFRFVTWEMNSERTGFAMGHYFYRNEYEKAKDDFLMRSGLLDKGRVFDSDQISSLYTALLYHSINDATLGDNEKQSIDLLLQKIESLTPHPPNPLHSPLQAELDLEQ